MSSSSSSSSSRRRKRAEPKHQPAAPASVDVVPHHTQQQPQEQQRTGGGRKTYPSGLVSHLPIAVCREAAITADAARIPDPELTAVSPADVATAVAARLCTQLPQRVPRSTIKTLLPTAALEVLVTQVTAEAVDVLAGAWSRAVAEETARAAAAATHHQQLAQIAGQWNRKSRPVGLLGSPGLGCGVNVLPYLHRSVEGRALHATSQEMGRACRLSSTRWAVEVLSMDKWRSGMAWFEGVCVCVVICCDCLMSCLMCC
jgi:hypothetical protein